MGIIADKIRKAIFGREVRDSIADGIELVEELREDYDNQVINAGNSNAEIVDARGGETKLKDRLDKFDEKLEESKIKINTKVDKVQGKGLSTHDYNNKDKIEVSKISGKAEKTELNAINERISNIISHNEDVSGNSELIDIRTDITGKIHGSAGDAIRDQITTLNNNTESLSNSIFEENIVEWDNTRIIDQN
ncbi:hypothetical protein, partial [Clostridium sp.]|uniref:hypothetical protein n=1 Tax=Clostridium sp. TaxID=1506 RepID=UPI002901312B|nr:hypothetical protein [Clostridium sp.]MDU3354865.1 hypothetical protein [Clostridium sp.]